MTLYAPILLPAVLAGLCLLVAWRMWRRRNLAKDGHWGGAAAIALGYFSGHLALVSWPAFPPAKAVDWLAYLAIVAGFTGIAQRYWAKRWYSAWPVRLLLSALFAVLILRGYLEHTWARTEGILWIAGLVLAMSALWDTLERLASKRTGASLPLSLCMLCACAAGALGMSGSALLGQLMGALAAACGAAVVLAWWAPGLSLKSGTMAAFVPIYSGLLIQAYFYSELPVLSAVLLYAAPYVLWYGERRNIYFMKPTKAAVVRLMLVGVPLAIALWLAYAVMANTPADDYYY